MNAVNHLARIQHARRVKRSGYGIPNFESGLPPSSLMPLECAVEALGSLRASEWDLGAIRLVERAWGLAAALATICDLYHSKYLIAIYLKPSTGGGFALASNRKRETLAAEGFSPRS